MRNINKKILKFNIEERINDDLLNHRISGASIIVKQAGETVYRNCLGTTVPGASEPVNDGTIFRLASMTKPVTAVATMVLYDRGLICLDDPIEKYLPEYGKMFISEVDENKCIKNIGMVHNKITILNLLTHTSGIGCDAVGEIQIKNMTAKDKSTIEDTVSYFSRQGLAFEPSTKQAYSGFAAFDVLTMIIEKITGEDYYDFLHKNIFIPCDMKDTVFVPTKEQWSRMIAMHSRENGKSIIGETTDGCVFYDIPCEHYLGGAGLVATIDDYSNFAEMLLNNGRFNDSQVISEKAVKMISMAYVPESMQAGSERWGLGVRVIVNDNTLPVGAYGWSGAYGTHFWVDPVNKITAVYMKNSSYDGGSGAVAACQFEAAVYGAL